MRLMWLYPLLALTPAALAAEWQPLPSPSAYRAQIDLAAVSMQNGYANFILHRAFIAPQPHVSGKDYYSTRAQYLGDCKEAKASLAVTSYYGADRKLIQASIHANWKSAFLAPPPGSDLTAALKQACQHLADSGGSAPAGADRSAAPAQPLARKTLTGSGIVIDRDGLILTNRHVVQQCDSYQVMRDATRVLKASLRATDAAKDLALLAVEETFPAAATLRTQAAPALGEAVTVVGYPLVNVLGAQPSVAFGHVSSTVGIRGNPAQMQISVPVQRGNSGGPVLDASGNLVGIVVAKLDALKVAQRTGDLPQNINFAIRGDVLRAFLEAQQVKFAASNASAKLENTELASRGAAVTVLVRCIQEPPAAGAEAAPTALP